VWRFPEGFLKTTLVFYMKKKNTPFMITEAVTQYSLERPQWLSYALMKLSTLHYEYSFFTLVKNSAHTEHHFEVLSGI